MRAFVAIRVPEAVRRALIGLKDELASAGADVKWVGSEQLHITLKFLGEITEEQAGAVQGLLAEIGREHSPVDLQLERIGAFPSLTSPRVVWVGVGLGRDPVVEMAQALEEGSRRLGLPREERPFSAHVTLGRVRSPRGRKQLIERLREVEWQSPSAWRAESLRLYHSVLRPAGPAYTVLADVPLTA